MGIFGRIKEGLQKTRETLRSGITKLFSLRRQIDQSTLDELEEVLYTADLGGTEVSRIMTELQDAYRFRKIEDTDQLREHLKRELKASLKEVDASLRLAPTPPTIILVVGVNGSGKTTTIAKLARSFQRQNKKVLLAACDTFRAAATEQLQIWADRLGVGIVRHQQGSDPAAVAFDAAEASVSRGVDVLIADTAGRLHTKEPLMRELDKIVRVLKKKVPDAPHETLLVLDATTGQNALAQAKTFSQAIGITGLVLAKLDGTAKGGIIVPIQRQLRVPVKFVGIGEKADDLEPFDADSFVDALFEG